LRNVPPSFRQCLPVHVLSDHELLVRIYPTSTLSSPASSIRSSSSVNPFSFLFLSARCPRLTYVSGEPSISSPPRPRVFLCRFFSPSGFSTREGYYFPLLGPLRLPLFSPRLCTFCLFVFFFFVFPNALLLGRITFPFSLVFSRMLVGWDFLSQIPPLSYSLSHRQHAFRFFLLITSSGSRRLFSPHFFPRIPFPPHLGLRAAPAQFTFNFFSPSKISPPEVDRPISLSRRRVFRQPKATDSLFSTSLRPVLRVDARSCALSDILRTYRPLPPLQSAWHFSFFFPLVVLIRFCNRGPYAPAAS